MLEASGHNNPRRGGTLCGCTFVESSLAKPGPVAMWSQYLAARTAVSAMTCFDVETNLHLASSIGALIHRFDKTHANRSRANLRRSFPNWPEDRVDATAKASMQHLVRFSLEMLYTPRLIHDGNWADRLQTGRMGECLALLNSGKPCILVTGHFGNFEMLGYALSTLGYRVDAIARPLDNPLIYDWILGIRESKGMKIITKWDATEQMVDVMHAGGALAFIADQNAGRKGLFVPFMGRLASAYKSVAIMARRYNAPVVCGYAMRRGMRFAYEFGTTDIIYPHEWETQHDPLYYITARYTRALEVAVRMQPDQYWWMHRRWKTRPKFETEGKPMPRFLRRNLEALPWMTQGLMDELQKPAEKLK